MVPIDGSKYSIIALQAAVGLAKDYYAELYIVHALMPHSLPASFSAVSNGTSTAEIYEEEEKKATRSLDDAVSFAKKQGVKAKSELLRKEMSIVETIVTAASDEKVDLIVIGTRGLGDFKRMLIGSVSTGVVTHARCPVLVVR